MALAALPLNEFEFDAVLVTDADSTLDPVFLETALGTLMNPMVGAVGGIFRAIHGRNLLGQMQSNEYDRYGRKVGRRRGRAFVLTGTATLFRTSVLMELKKRRGYFYETKSRTEDNEITLAIRHLGHDAVSPRRCLVFTETMPNLRSLWRQRKRWYLGSIEDLRRYGWTKVTAPYILRHGLLILSVLMMGLYLVVLALYGSFHFAWPWAVVTVIFMVERAVTVRRGGKRAIWLALMLVPEACYAIFLQLVYLWALIGALFKFNERRW